MLGVAHVLMTVEAGEHTPPRLKGKEVIHQILVTGDAGLFDHASVARLDLDRVGIAPCGKSQRMKKAVIPFGHPLADRVVGKMAIVAGGDRMVARLEPRVVVGLHHVAIGTRGRVAAEVRMPVTVAEGKESQAPQCPQGHGEPEGECPEAYRGSLLRGAAIH